MSDTPAYYMRYSKPYVAWFCTEADASRFLEYGSDDGRLAPAEFEPGLEYEDEGHDYCFDDACPAMVALREADFAEHADGALAVANATFDTVVRDWPKE